MVQQYFRHAPRTLVIGGKSHQFLLRLNQIGFDLTDRNSTGKQQMKTPRLGVIFVSCRLLVADIYRIPFIQQNFADLFRRHCSAYKVMNSIGTKS